MRKDDRNKIIKSGAYGQIKSISLDKLPESLRDKNKSYVTKINDKSTDVIGMVSFKEIDILVKCNTHPFIVQLVYLNYNKDSPDSEDPVSLFLEEANYDLRHVLDSSKSYNMCHYKVMMVQLVLGLKFLHSNNILHRDIKPENILIYDKNMRDKNRTVIVKFCDFGLSTYIDGSNILTPRSTTPNYASPEILLNKTNYSYESDIWSLGCVFYEMISGKIYLDATEPGNKDIHLYYFSYLISKSTKSYTIEKIKNIFDIENSGGKFTKEIPNWLGNPINKNGKTTYVKKSFRELTNLLSTSTSSVKIEKTSIKDPMYGDVYFGSLDTFFDFIGNTLRIESGKRFNINQCINHEFFSSFRTKINEIEKDLNESKKNLLYRRIHIFGSLKRTICLNKLQNILMVCKDYGWFMNKIMFHTVDIFDRFYEKEKFLFNSFNEHIILITCFYIVCKFFRHYDISKEFLENTITSFCLSKIPDIYDKIIECEIKITTTLQWKLFLYTIYEHNNKIPNNLSLPLLFEALINIDFEFYGNSSELYDKLEEIIISKENKILKNSN